MFPEKAVFERREKARNLLKKKTVSIIVEGLQRYLRLCVNITERGKESHTQRTTEETYERISQYC